MQAWEILKHLESGKAIYFEDAEIFLKDLAGWDYDPIRNPKDYSLTKPKVGKNTTKTHDMSKEMQEFRIKTWGCNLKNYVWKNNQYVHKSVAKGSK